MVGAVSLDFFGPESLNALDRWRMDSDRREQERAQAKEQVKREQERHERRLARAGAREEIAALRAELASMRTEHESLCRTLSDALTATSDTFRTLDDMARAQREEIADVKLAIARISPAEAKRAFQFAREKSDGDVGDLPDLVYKKAH